MAPRLVATSLSKSFRRQSVIVDATLAIEPGEAVAVVGANGCGKTTLLRLLAGVVRPDGGSVHVDGRVGYCPQRPGLVDGLAVSEHVRLVGSAADGRAEDEALAVLQRLSVDPSDPKPVGLLSGGQRQKVNLALAAMAAPAVMLLDEPYQGLDQGSYERLWVLFQEWLEKGRSVLTVTHLLPEADLVDRVLTLEGGVLR